MPATQTTQRSLERRRSIKILVLDDEEHLARMFCGALQDRGYACEFATRPAQAFELIRQGSYAILVSDILMPGMNGLELMAKALRIRPALKVIFVTGVANVETAVEALKTGAVDFIPKPFDLEQLCTRIDTVADALIEDPESMIGFREPDTSHCPDLPGYQIIKRIGVGAMGSVFQAKQVALNRLVAIKVIRPSGYDASETLTRFLREARAAARMSHANIIDVHDLVRHQGCLFLIMEHFPSRTVTEIVARAGRLPWQKAVWITVQMARALKHASSQGVVHRDMKPSNILVGKGWAAKLTDFGLAKHCTIVSDSDLDGAGTRIGAIVGTPAYLSPEQAVAMPNLDVRSDIYGLGLSLYFMLEGKNPYCGNVAELVGAQIRTPLPRLKAQTVPEALERVLRRMTHKDREQRFQTPDQVLVALRKAVSSAALPSADSVPGLTSDG
jgi:CheY-like chemotaxis protein